MKRARIVAVIGVSGLIFGFGVAVSNAQPDTTVVQPPPMTVTPPPMTVTLPPPPPPVTTTVTAPPETTTVTAPPETTTVTLPPPPPVTTTVTAPPETTTVTVTPPPTTTTTPTTTTPPTTTTTTPTTTTTAPPPPCGGPINITTGGTYSGCYQSSNTGTPAVTISTTAPVTLARVHIIAKGNGVQGVSGTRLTVSDSTFDQTDPGATVKHRAVELTNPVSFVFINNLLTDTDGVWIGSSSGSQITVNPLTVNANMFVNIGRYPHPTSPNCCVQALQLDHVSAPAGLVQWNHTRNVFGQSGVEDNVDLYVSGGTDATHRFDIGWNLIDGAYPRTPDAGFTGGGLNTGDGGGAAAHNQVHDNTVVSTTNYGVAVNSIDNYASNNTIVNDGAEQTSSFGQAISAFSPTPTPSGLHATGTKYNYHRSTTDSTQYPCYISTYCSGTQVTTTEQQARDAWEASRVSAGVTVGPRP